MSNSTEKTNQLLGTILIGTFLYSLTLWTIFGNILVVIALFTNKKLKQGGMSNYLIGNLALSDLLLGLTVMPFSATLDTFDVWPFGTVLCEIWLSIDVLCCTASIWGLLVISLDRFIATNRPILYMKHKNNITLAIVYCTISWFISISISLGPLLFRSADTKNDLTNASHQNNNDTNYLRKNAMSILENPNVTTFECVLFHTPSFVILSSIGSFYLPLTIMTLLYMGVFYRIREKSKQFKRNSTEKKKFKENTELIRQQIQFKRDQDHELSCINYQENESEKTIIPKKKSGGKQSFSQNSEARVTKKLAIIMITFVACWLPFFVIYIVRSLLKGPNSVPDSFMSFFIWLGYFNSSVNPLLYAILNENFRVAFKNIILFMPNVLCNKRDSNNKIDNKKYSK